MTQEPSSSATLTPSGDQDLYSHEKLVSIAKNNQKQQQQKRRSQQKRKANTAKHQPRQQLSPHRRKKNYNAAKGKKQQDNGNVNKSNSQMNQFCQNHEQLFYSRQSSIWRNNKTVLSFASIRKNLSNHQQLSNHPHIGFYAKQRTQSIHIR